MTSQPLQAAPAPGPLVLTARQTAAALQICTKTLWALTRDGKLPVVRIGGRAIRYDLGDIRRFIESSKTKIGGNP